MGRQIQLVMLMVLGMVSSSALASDGGVPMGVNTNTSGESVASAPASGLVTRSGKKETIIKINNSCFGTNLRGVGNPLAPNSIIEGLLVVSINGKDYEIKAEYPADLVTRAGMTSLTIQPMADTKFSVTGGGASAGIFGNSVVIKTPIAPGISIDSSGAVTGVGGEKVTLKSYKFDQHISGCSSDKAIYGAYGYSSYTPTYPCGEYMGKEGPLSATFGGISVSSDNSNIEIDISFPGQTGFCGGFWSPLMVFFDEARPRFDNVSSFPLNPTGKTMWPEADAPGWFVAFDRDQSGKIDKKNELFGDNAAEENGFEVLRQFDSNKDGVIDIKDKDFKKLVLWSDKNGDGMSQGDEVQPLLKSISKISLDYKKNVVQPLGRYAEARETAKFWYKKDGKIKVGEIVDIWLAPAETRLSQK